MPIITTEKQFESDIAAALLSPAGGYTRNGDCYGMDSSTGDGGSGCAISSRSPR